MEKKFMIYAYSHYEYEDAPLLFASMGNLSRDDKAQFLAELDLLYGDTTQDATEWALEYQLWARMLLHDNMLLLNPVYLDLSDMDVILKPVEKCFGGLVCLNYAMALSLPCSDIQGNRSLWEDGDPFEYTVPGSEWKPYEWTLTDDDCCQYVQRIEFTEFWLIQMSAFQPDDDQYAVYETTVDVDHYLLKCNADELAEILKPYGYEDAVSVFKLYGNASMQIIAECIFEHDLCRLANRLHIGSEEECIQYIRDYVEDHG